MDIGEKLREARDKNGLTQEQIAEKLGISRQTVSNWENDRSYPDIMSVLKLSDIYSVSLDELIKGDRKMVEHLEESTNTVKAKRNQTRVLTLLAFFIVWAVGILFFHLFMPSGDEMAYAVVFMYLVLPLMSFTVSIFIGKDTQWGKSKWLMPLIFGAALILSGYLTFDAANMVSTGRFLFPDLSELALFFILGTVPSYVGLLLSLAAALIKNKAKNT